ncbi:DUF4388 domain-containing protein [Gaopeijia maritima]|uniref:DUF4388 domain-containing protein n=1 Tax=Gaopeijia maritima TaxID=3119007 RepID=A0ABU9E7C4_9BACT
MKKKARLDQVLLHLGYATQGDIHRALERQKERGGRLGSHLVALGVLDPVQLVEALATQFDLPWTPAVRREVDPGLARRLPPALVLERAIVPIDLARGSLTLLVADPLDREAFESAREAIGADRVVVMLAPASVVEELGSRLLPEAARAREEASTGIELPELFEVEAARPISSDDEPDDVAVRRRVLMVVDGAAHRNFLPPVFEKEGCGLVVASTADDVREALGSGDFEQVVVSRELWDDFAAWIRTGAVPSPSAEVTVFPSVHGALLENPAPYELTVRSLRVALQALAEERSGRLRAAPPYGLMAEDLDALARRYGLRRLALDGLHLALHLLVPSTGQAEGSGGPFEEFSTSLELASALRFPFRVDTLLGVCHALFRGRVKPDSAGEWGEEVHLAAQILALVWYRHTVVAATEEAGSGVPGSALRGEAGALAGLEMIEVYLRIIGDRGESATEGLARDVLLVGGDRIQRTLGGRLRRMGCRPFDTADLDDAISLAERQPPAALIIDDDVFGADTRRCCRALAEVETLVYVLTDSSDASRTLALLDAGADDVFAPAHEFDLMAARVSRAVRARSRGRVRSDSRATPRSGEFSASFEIFSFLDLVQTLSHSRKTARIEVTRGNGDEAVVFTDGGRVIHASCGEVEGEEAVYRVIAWEDDGHFVVHTETDPPEPTIFVATDAVLMEGCRLLDESKV